MRILDTLKALTLNPKYRLQRHVDYLKEHIDIPQEHDAENFARVYRNFEKTYNRLTLWQWLRNLSFVLLYVSFITALAQNVTPELTLVLRPVVALAGVLGAAVLTLLLVFFNRVAGTVQTDLMIEHAHLVAIAVKHNDDFIVHPNYKWGLFTEYE